MSLMLGPMTRGDIRKAREWREKIEGSEREVLSLVSSGGPKRLAPAGGGS
jgi:hypothetical protein